MKLRLKPTILPYRMDREVVLHVSGQYARIPDPHGAIWELTHALDGEHTTAELTDFICKQYPETDRAQIESVIGELIRHRMVEIPEEELTTSLREDLRIRFSRNLDFFGSLIPFGDNKYIYQERLQAARICVLGCGGLGTHILFDLAAVGVKHLTILDFDRIELSNLNRQILYKESDIGLEKVDTAKRRLLEFNSGLEIRTHHRRLDSTESVGEVVQGHDLVICIADKPANYMAEWLNAACATRGIPFVTGGVDVRRAVMYSVQPGASGCVSCWMECAFKASSVDQFVISKNKRDDITHARPLPAFVPLVAVTAGIMVSEAIKFITRCQPPGLTNKLKEFSFDDLEIGVAERWERIPNCRVCGIEGAAIPGGNTRAQEEGTTQTGLL